MTYMVSTAEESDKVWFIANRLTDWFMENVLAEVPADSECAERLRMSTPVNGISIDTELVENPAVGQRILEALRAGAERIQLLSSVDDDTKEHVKKLICLLDEWEHEEGSRPEN